MPLIATLHWHFLSIFGSYSILDNKPNPISGTNTEGFSLFKTLLPFQKTTEADFFPEHLQLQAFLPNERNRSRRKEPKHEYWKMVGTSRNYFCRVPKGPGVFKGGGNWGTLRIPAGKIGEP